MFKHSACCVCRLQLVEEGVSYLNWTSSGLPDFLAKLKGSLTIGLLPLVEEVLKETRSIEATVASWRQLPSLDIFTDCDSNDLAEISGKHRLGIHLGYSVLL